MVLLPCDYWLKEDLYSAYETDDDPVSARRQIGQAEQAIVCSQHATWHVGAPKLTQGNSLTTRLTSTTGCRLGGRTTVSSSSSHT